MPLNEMVTSYFGNRYVDRVKLNALLQKIFGQNYNVVVSAHTTMWYRYCLLTPPRSQMTRSQWRGIGRLQR